MLSSDTAMILLNALHFQDDWQYEFDESSKMSFKVTPTESVQVDSMTLLELLDFGRFNRYRLTALRLPYIKSHVEMLILLPDKNLRLDILEKHLKHCINDIWNGLRRTGVNVTIPKFEIEFEAELKEPLEKVRNFLIH